MTVLILGGADDEHALHVLKRLNTAGADAELLDSRHFPYRVQLSYQPATGFGRLRLASGRTLDFAEIQAVYWRSYDGIGPADLPDPEQAFVAHNDARSLFETFLINLGARWVNGWRAFQLHQTKPVQLALVAGLGVEIPATLLGNDPDAVRDFAAGYPRTVFKPVQGGAHTRPLRPEHLSPEGLERLRLAPVTLQEEVPGTNIRVFVAGHRVHACEVRTPAVDFRDDPHPQLLVHVLPATVEVQSVRIARALELLWTGIDYRLTPEGQYVFLEANPSPMFLGFERATSLPLTESLLALLTDSGTPPP